MMVKKHYKINKYKKNDIKIETPDKNPDATSKKT